MIAKWPVYVFVLLCVCYVSYSCLIWCLPGNMALDDGAGDLVAQGRMVYQKYSCKSCHQLYGLGGHLGPDLTNVYEENDTAGAYIRAMVQVGSRQMPRFELSAGEQRALVAFFKHADATGVADPREFTTSAWGSIAPKNE
jgi:nitric oxide reductase subunit C